MAYTLAPVSYGSGTHDDNEPAKLQAAPPIAPLALAEARVSQVEAEADRVSALPRSTLS